MLSSPRTAASHVLAWDTLVESDIVDRAFFEVPSWE